MTWSTRELADLAGTTVNTVRHYHSIGLLQAPERSYNGYKRYRVGHLVRLIQVRRLAELGVPLANVEAAGPSGLAVPGGLGELDTQVQAEIKRLHVARADIAAILRDNAPVDTPRGFESMASRLSEADRALIHVFARLYDTESMANLKQMVAAESEDLRRDFDNLPVDSDGVTRQRVVHRISAEDANWRSPDPPWSIESVVGLRGAADIYETLSAVLQELYNSAQHDVVRRADVYASETEHSLVSAS
ncbi:MerR family transcriptional regulator [Cryobacterium lactosi]|uniref:MerR family transcriptional regulator n=1 Tax=Cryobacterium lactosi TaxID=1259202 RepID=UPI00141B2AB7|nr:MerR family transcriptional regulator [Cryobacterium lactosi]